MLRIQDLTCFTLWPQMQPWAFIVLTCSPRDGHLGFFQMLFPHTTQRTSPIPDSGVLASDDNCRRLSRIAKLTPLPITSQGGPLDTLQFLEGIGLRTGPSTSSEMLRNKSMAVFGEWTAEDFLVEPIWGMREKGGRETPRK